jgi:hypothetical protein
VASAPHAPAVSFAEQELIERQDLVSSLEELVFYPAPMVGAVEALLSVAAQLSPGVDF